MADDPTKIREPLDGRELLAIRARTMRARDGQHQSLAQTEADREELLRELEGFRESRHFWRALAAKRWEERETLKAARCPSCDHRTSHHQPEGCWYTFAVAAGATTHDLVCACTVPLAALDATDNV